MIDWYEPPCNEYVKRAGDMRPMLEDVRHSRKREFQRKATEVNDRISALESQFEKILKQQQEILDLIKERL